MQEYWTGVVHVKGAATSTASEIETGSGAGTEIAARLRNGYERETKNSNSAERRDFARGVGREHLEWQG